MLAVILLIKWSTALLFFDYWQFEGCLCYRKATKFYMMDLCVNPERFDSWAGMALARASRLETKLSAVSVLFVFGLEIIHQLYMC
jgi:hypothetical protein